MRLPIYLFLTRLLFFGFLKHWKKSTFVFTWS